MVKYSNHCGREREHGNSYVLATEGTDKTFIRGQQLLKPHSVPRHILVNKPVQEELPARYTPPVTRSKTKSYAQAVTLNMPKSPKTTEVCRRTITAEKDVQHSGEGRRGHDEPRREQLRSVQPIGGHRSDLRFKSPIICHGRNSSPGHVLTVQVLESEPDDQAYDKRREGKAKSSKKTVRSRRVVIDNTPGHTDGSHDLVQPATLAQRRRSCQASCQ